MHLIASTNLQEHIQNVYGLPIRWQFKHILNLYIIDPSIYITVSEIFDITATRAGDITATRASDIILSESS